MAHKQPSYFNYLYLYNFEHKCNYLMHCTRVSLGLIYICGPSLVGTRLSDTTVSPSSTVATNTANHKPHSRGTQFLQVA